MQIKARDNSEDDVAWTWTAVKRDRHGIDTLALAGSGGKQQNGQVASNLCEEEMRKRGYQLRGFGGVGAADHTVEFNNQSYRQPSCLEP